MPSPDRVALAHERLAARARRIRLIRRRAVAGTVAAFVLAWGVVAFDGSMGAPASTATAQVTSATPTATATATATPSASSSDTTTSSDDTSTSSDDSAAPLTTSQS
jgi:hypothetical protein